MIGFSESQEPEVGLIIKNSETGEVLEELDFVQLTSLVRYLKQVTDRKANQIERLVKSGSLSGFDDVTVWNSKTKNLPDNCISVHRIKKED